MEEVFEAEEVVFWEEEEDSFFESLDWACVSEELLSEVTGVPIIKLEPEKDTCARATPRFWS